MVLNFRGPELISGEHYLSLLNNLKFGSSIAEQDWLLEESRVELSAFGQLLRDEIDIVRGMKGSGKSALYRLFSTSYLLSYLLEERGIIALKGVDRVGDPVFSKFSDQFDALSETDFQNFWRIYFVSLVNAMLLESKEHSKRFVTAKTELKDYRRLVKQHGFPLSKNLLTPDGLIQWVFSRLPKPVVKATLDAAGTWGAQVELGLIRFGGHLPRGGYDVQNAIRSWGPASPATVL